MDWREFYDFCHDILDYGQMAPQPHDEMCQFIASLFPDLSFKGDEQHSGMLLVPRDTFKTSLGGVGLPLFLLWKNRNSRGLISGHRHDRSKQLLTAIKWHIVNNDKFKELCGSWKPQFKEQKWAEDAIVILGRTIASVDPSIDTCGVDRSKVGAHPDWIIADDVHSESNINTATMRNKVLDHLINMYPMLQPGGTMLVIGTRWHYADAYGKLIDLDTKAIQDDQPPRYKTLIRSCYLYDEAGKKSGLYFPTRLTETFLTRARYEVGPTKFSLWYHNKPIADDNKLFPKEQLNQKLISYYYDSDLGMPTMGYDGQDFPVNVTLAWDPAGIHPTDKSDFHGVSIVGCDQEGRWLIPKAEAIKGKPSRVVERVAGYVIMYRPDTIIVESVGQSGLWAYYLKEHLKKIGEHCPPIVFYKPPTNVDKNARIETRLQPMHEAGTLIVDKRCRELIDQLDNFPQLDFDDILDSVQMHGDYVKAANPEDLDILYEHALLDTDRDDDPRMASGAYAGRFSSQWASLAKTS